MNEEVQQQSAPAHGAAAVWVAAILVLAGIAGYYVLDGHSSWLRWLAVVAGVAAGALVFMLSAQGAAFRRFAVAARNELRKVFWPTRQEAWQTTAVVFGFAAVAGIFFWLLDMFLAWATRWLTGQGG